MDHCKLLSCTAIASKSNDERSMSFSNYSVSCNQSWFSFGVKQVVGQTGERFIYRRALLLSRTVTIDRIDKHDQECSEIQRR